MMFIEVTKEQFEAAVYTATDSTGEVYEGIQDYLYDAEEYIRYELFGMPLVSAYSTLPENEQRILRSIKSLRAFEMAIPYLDLVLTPTGFGIVNSTNIAPASKERVAALRQKVTESMNDAIERFIYAITNENTWLLFAEGKTIDRMIDSLYYTSSTLRLYAGVADATRLTLLAMRPAVRKAESWLCRFISTDYWLELIDHIKMGTLSLEETNIVISLQKIIGQLVAENKRSAEMLVYEFVNRMEADLVSYPTYANSVEYKAKHFERYENKKEDTTFFFNG